MEMIFKIAAGGIVAVILVTNIKSRNKEMALVLSIAACTVIAVAGLTMFKTVVGYIDKLRLRAGISSSILAPVIKACGIGVVTRLCVLFCQEAGEGAVGKVVELCGSAAAVCAVLPLLDLVMEMLLDFLGG